MKKNNLKTRLLLLFAFFAAAGFSAFAQTPVTEGKDILLFETDFTDWTPMTNPGNDNPILVTTSGGAGFSVGRRAEVSPTGSQCGDAGYLKFNNENGTGLTSPQFNFVEGGVVELWLCQTTGSNNRPAEVMGADAAAVAAPFPTLPRYDRSGVGTTGSTTPTAPGMAMGTTSADRGILDNSKVGVYLPGSVWVASEASALYKVSFRLPAGSFTGLRNVQINNHRDVAIVAMKFYSTIGTTPYVAATNYVNLVYNPNASGHTMQGNVAGAAGSGVPVNDLVNVRGWNISGDVVLSIEGADAAKFSFPAANADGTFTVANADALAGINVPIHFTPSVREGIATAALVITNPNNPAQTYKVALTGITGDGSTNPAILANTNPIPFYTSVIADVTLPFSLAGVNLTGPVTVSFEGPIASRFTASETSILAVNAMAGRTINLTFTGTIAPSEYNDMFLVLKSPGAADVRVPILAVTRDVRPTFGEISFSVDPPGTAFLDLSLAGPIYEIGTTITVTVTPETGYEIARWSDNAGSRNPKRTFQVGLGTRNITVFMKKVDEICTDCPPPPGGFVAFTPTSNITADGFPANWTAATGDNPTYTVNVYADHDKAIPLASFPAGAGSSFPVTGVAPAAPTAETDFFRWYEVVAKVDPSIDNPSGVETTALVGPIRLTGTVPFVCGQ